MGGCEIQLKTQEDEYVMQKGLIDETDCYSAFIDDMGTNLGFDDKLRSKEFGEVTTLIIFGLATDYCVFSTARDAAKLGFKVFVIKELCRAVDAEFSWLEFEKLGINVVSLESFDNAVGQ